MIKYTLKYTSEFKRQMKLCQRIETKKHLPMT